MIFLYLVTNTETTESGIYSITPKKIASRTGLSPQKVEKVLGNGNLKNISYDYERKCVFVHNFLRYNRRGRPDIIQKSIELMVQSLIVPLQA